MLSINTNVFALTAEAALNSTQNPLQTSMQRLSTGLRINSAADDAAGLAIATGMQAQINGMNTAITNANNGVGLLQTAQGAITSITDNLQTIRELAVESANATNTPQDRQALNTEAQQLIQEIDRVASTTSFNNVNLLDGSFSNATFQVGANAGQTITIGAIASARTSALMGSAPGFATADAGLANSVNGGSGAAISTIAAGDLTINAVAIGSSVAGTASADQTANSAWAIANAINAASGTGVTATANATTITAGSAPVTVTTAGIAANTITINGISIGSSAQLGTGSAAAQGVALATAINLMSTQTGVTATANTTTGGITLTSSEGGNIVLAGASSYGMGSSATYQGKVTIGSESGTITIGGNTASSTGISAGSYTNNMSGASASSAPSVLNYGDLTINGVAINVPTAGGAGQTADSAWALANAINSATGTGVTATANATNTGALGSATTFSAVAANAFTINGVDIGAISASSTDGVQEGAAIAQAINLITSQTGVTASADSVTGKITLTAADGRDIAIGTGGSTFGLGGPATYQGSISLSSTASSGIVVGGNSASSAGLTAGTYAATENTQIISVAQINISTVTGANEAMSTVDAALNQIDLSAANLGAYQNRFTSAVTTLQNTSNNLSSAKSQIMDADYATESSNLTKAMIAEQAGISVLAQANTIPQQILALLPKS